MHHYDPYAHAAELEISVAIGNASILDQLRADGVWFPDRNAIIIRPTLTAVQERCVLTHEIGHAVHGHRSTTPKNEMLADRYAAEMLVDRTILLDAMEVTANYAAWANELRITTKIMRMYLNVHRLDLERGREEPYRVEPMVLRAVG